MASSKSLITALAAAGLVTGLGFAYAQSSYDTAPATDPVAAQQAPTDAPQHPALPAQSTTPAQPDSTSAQNSTPVDSQPMATPQPQYNDAPGRTTIDERAPRADRN